MCDHKRVGYRHFVRVLFIVEGLMLAGTARATETCPLEWLPGEGLRGLNGPVYAVTSWDPDGAGGPQPALLVAGGQFTIAGNVFASNLAAWDGSTWQPLGGGTTGPVYALTVFGGQLAVGGSFTTAGGISANRVALWNGATWTALGLGVNNTVRALAVFYNQLVAGGQFTLACGEAR
jgi:hypothetical protein